MPECRSCGAPIVWVKLLKKDGTESNHPVDAAPLGKALVRFGPNGERAKFSETWQSHYSSCPDATKWRGGRDRED